MERYLENQIISDLQKKMVFIGGPRQVGKTTLSRKLATNNQSYLNWDDEEDRERILKKNFPVTDLWIFDEIHKYRNWRNLLKGLYDKNNATKKILVTGSARLDLYRRSGDSLQGRYHYLRLHPITLDELSSDSQKDLETLFTLGGFPEPFLGGNHVDAKRWSREYRQRILRDDISSIETISDITSAEILMLRLPELVGGTLSINSLQEDMQTSFKTIQRWLTIFEHCYAIYRLRCFGGPTIKALKKAQKHYHFDWTLIQDIGLRFENLCAGHLLKWCNFFEDIHGRDLELCYYRDNEQREVDFVVTENKKPILFVEAKSSEKTISPHLKFLKRKFPNVPAFQVLYQGGHHFASGEGIIVGPARLMFSELKKIIEDGVPPTL